MSETILVCSHIRYDKELGCGGTSFLVSNVDDWEDSWRYHCTNCGLRNWTVSKEVESLPIEVREE